MAFIHGSQIETETLNITYNLSDEKTLTALINHVGLFTRDIEVQFHHKLLRLSREKIKVACQIVGCKPVLAKSLSDKTFETVLDIIKNECCLIQSKNEDENKSRRYIYTTKTQFLKIFKEELIQRNLTKDRNILDFELALNIIEQSQSMIVLLGGTSGSGKSTVASVLASRFGIPTVLSTDSIRHIMRNFMSADECPVLFCSTYEAGSKIKCDEDVKESKRIVMGFQQQAAKVQQRLESILQDFYDRGESIVVEGVHLTPDFLTAMLKKFDNCIPFLIYISNESKHRERFAVRSKYMTLEKRHNKYVQNFVSIRHIQKHLTKKADEYLIPKIDNSNVDKSVGIVHRTLVRCLRRIMRGESLYDPENKNALKIYEQFNTVTKNIWSSEAVKKYIHSKGKKTYKNEIFKRFFEQNAKPLTKDFYEKIEPEIRQNLLGDYQEKADENKGKAEKSFQGEKKADGQALNKSKAFKEDFIILDPQIKGYSDEPKYTQSDNFEADKNFEDSQTYPDSPERPKGSPTTFEQGTIDLQKILGKGKSFEEEDGRRLITQKSADVSALSKSQEDLKVLTNMVNRPGTTVRPIKIKSEEVKLEDVASAGYQTSPHLKHKPGLKFSLLEEALKTRRVLTIKGFTPGNIRVLKRFVDGYNVKHQDGILKLYQDNQRLILQKKRKTEKESNSPVLQHKAQTLPTELTARTLSRFATKRYDDYSKSQQEHEKVNDTNTSEDNLEASDEESSPGVNSQDKWSIATGNLGIDKHMMKRGSTYYNMSDKLDMSDDMGSATGLEEDENSLEVLESGNSISEQSIEEDEDEDEMKLTVDRDIIVNIESNNVKG